MKNNTTKLSASKKQQQSPRSPLKVKDLNVSTSSSCSLSSSFSSSISSEAPRGCLRFLLSHNSSAVSRNASNKKPTSCFADKTPKSAPSVRRLKGKLSCNGDMNVKSGANLRNPEKNACKNVKRLKKKPPTPCLYSWKSGRKPSSRLDLSDVGSKKSDKKLCENDVIFAPVNEKGCGFDLGSADCDSKVVKLVGNDPDCCDTCSPIPPIEASLSPEIQGGSTSVVKATPSTCYAAGHVLSGISDKRKCRPRGLLTIGDNDLFGSSKTKVFCSDDEDITGASSKPRVSLVPCPIEASMQWILSPCDERRSKDNDDNNDDDVDGDGDKIRVRLNECETSMPFKLIACSSSASSSLGFSSELSRKSNSAITASDATTVSHGSRSRSSEFQGLIWPSFDHMVRNLSPSSPDIVTSSMVKVSPENETHSCSYERETTPCSVDSIGSENVIQTPQSNTSSQNFRLSHLSRDEISRLWFECELNSVTEVLRRTSLSPDCELPVLDSPRTSFEFNPLIRPDNSIDLSIFRKAVYSQSSPGVSEPLPQSLPESKVRISWREGLSSRIFEMDELDCCRCFTDEEDAADGAVYDSCEPTSCHEVVDYDSSKILDSASSLDSQKNAKTDVLKFSNGDGSTDVVEDVSWKVCENHMFQV